MQSVQRKHKHDCHIYNPSQCDGIESRRLCKSIERTQCSGCVGLKACAC